MAPTDLALRSSPQQARSRATMDRILAASAQLLDEVGVEAFNTNLLAARAGVGVRAIYRYFPNKWAILVALTASLRETERAWIGDLRRVGDAGGWRAALDRAIDGYYAAASRCPGYAALRAASRAVPELRALDAEDNEALAADLGEGLAALGLTLDAPRMRALCRTILEASSRILDLALTAPPEEAVLLVAELKRMIAGLLESYLG